MKKINFVVITLTLILASLAISAKAATNRSIQFECKPTGVITSGEFAASGVLQADAEDETATGSVNFKLRRQGQADYDAPIAGASVQGLLEHIPAGSFAVNEVVFVSAAINGKDTNRLNLVLDYAGPGSHILIDGYRYNSRCRILK